ncbi:hypothetical protein ETD86_12930 [Nonomuraea turkmeniaca]|uniref:Helix-turn-helix domain-containing protein n=1 Tax=Nonomuraea turkmeniaca TaxID=103838 RepID=A0A5S4FMW4_9ACTN|nr:hypothetical protein [Nonomuraea turkmeniaca]TMR22066.1 hypothetical protein ETD86_12930 [Nonomuraea turkmeniaca]
MKLREGGWTYAAISRQYNVSLTTVRNAIDPPPSPRADRPPFDVEAAAARYRSGMTIREIARETGYSRQHVHTALTNAGVEMRPLSAPRASRITSAKRAAIVALWQEGTSLHQIAVQVGSTGETIRKVLAGAGIDVTSRIHRIDHNRARELRLAGWTLARIGAELGTSPQYVWNITRDVQGVPDRRGRARIVPEIAVKMYRTGATMAQIGQRFGTGRYAVRAVLEEHGVVIRHGGQQRRELDLDRARQLLADGASLRHVGRVLGCSASTLSIRLREAERGIQPGQRGGGVSLAKRRAIARAWKAGRSITWIRAHVHVSYTTAVRVVRELGDDPARARQQGQRGPRPESRRLNHRRMTQLHARGWSAARIAQDLQASPQHVARVLRRAKEHLAERSEVVSRSA